MPTVEPISAHRSAFRAPPAEPPRRQASAPVNYPESDGKPMSETGIHWHATVDFAHPLMDRYADRRDVYVGSDMLLYYEEGNPRKAVSPDVFVVFGPNREPLRRTWLIWEEGKAPDFVLEVTSATTRQNDEGFKADLYARLGVTEYWQFDPLEDYLSPSLKGRCLKPDGTYQAIEIEQRDGGSSGWSALLGLELRPEGQTLRLFDPMTGKFQPTRAEKSQIIGNQAETIRVVNAELDAAKSQIAELTQRLAEGG